MIPIKIYIHLCPASSRSIGHIVMPMANFYGGLYIEILSIIHHTQDIRLKEHLSMGTRAAAGFVEGY